MIDDVDNDFYTRADSFIDFANQQCVTTDQHLVSGSFMYALARFNAWVSATGVQSSEEMLAMKAQRMEYFIAQYRAMLEENLDSYVKNFDDYMKPDA